jgi:hypothetical protein
MIIANDGNGSQCKSSCSPMKYQGPFVAARSGAARDTGRINDKEKTRAREIVVEIWSDQIFLTCS